MNILKTLSGLALTSFLIGGLISCEDGVSPTGGSLFNNEVQISVDSLTVKINSRNIPVTSVDARSTTNLIGNLDIKDYGKLSASYVTQLLAASDLIIPDSIPVERVDSTKLLLTVPRTGIIGDSLAPQQLTVYRLTRSLPGDIKSDFDPSGYYNAADPVNSKNYTLSGINLSDSAFYKNKNIEISVPLPRQWGTDAFTAYRTNPEIFQWPASFCKDFPGLYLTQSFGRGAMANISSSKVMIYYHYFIERTVVENEEAVKKVITMKDSVALFSSAPEVLSSTIFKYRESDYIHSLIASGKKLIVAPLGYNLDIDFPARELLESYWKSDHSLSVINNLTLNIPASPVVNSYGLVPPSHLLLIKKSEKDKFFANGELPDNKSSFMGTYSSAHGRYEFTSMREYLVGLIEKEQNITEEDILFELVPVKVTTETVKNADGSATTYTTAVTPYISSPVMAEIFTDRAKIVFTYTHQMVK
ncbi:MAG: DUF4270 domain-containing protein [Muribaculaceae bacterium]|nr:DUF4270 domain-containing protein [Muribaculaceae bacterium]